MVAIPSKIISIYSRIIPLLYIETAAIKQHCYKNVKNIQKLKNNVNNLHYLKDKKLKSKKKTSLSKAGFFNNEFV
jgi:hypothetical protein